MYNPGFGTKMWPLLLFLLALTPQSAAAPRDARLSPPLTATISGRITDKESGRPIPGALINARGAGPSHVVTARADGDGRYEISGLAPDLELFIQVAKIAERGTLTEDEERSLDLRVVHIR